MCLCIESDLQDISGFDDAFRFTRMWGVLVCIVMYLQSELFCLRGYSQRPGLGGIAKATLQQTCTTGGSCTIALFRSMNSTVSRRLLQVRPCVSGRSLQCRIVANRRFAQPKRAFSSRPTFRAADNSSNPDVVGHTSTKDDVSRGAAPKDSPQAKQILDDDLKFYGSARRRAMRSYRMRAEAEPISLDLPSDFLKCKVTLHDELSHDNSLVRPVPQGQPADRSIAGSPEDPGSGGQNIPPAEDSEGSENNVKYEVAEPIWNELDLSIKAGLQRQLTNGHQIRQTQPNIVVDAICENGQYFVQESIKQLARQHGANLVVIDAIDIGEIAEKSHHFNSDILSLIDLGFDVYKEKDTSQNDSSLFGEEDADSDTRDVESEAPDFMPQVASKPMTTSIHLNLPSSLKPFLRQARGQMGSSPSGIFVAGLGDEAKSFQERKESSLWDAMIQKILRAPSSKAGYDLFNEDPGSEISSTPMVILVQDLPEVLQFHTGERFLNKLVEAVHEKRRHGHSICIVGGTSGTTERSKSSSSDRPFPLDDDSSWQYINFPPLSRGKTFKTALYNDERQWYRSVNERLLVTTLRPKKSRDLPVVLDNRIFPSVDDAEKETIPLMARIGASQKYFSKGQVHRMATFIAGHASTASTEPFLAEEARSAIGQLLKSDAARRAWANEERKNDWGKLGELLSSADNDSANTELFERMEGKPKSQSKDERRRLISQKAKRHEKKFLGGVIEPDSIRTTFDTVHVPVETIDAVKTLTTLSLIRPDAFSYGVLASDKIPGLLLYGPPGTGKTLLAKAAAKESGATVLEVSGAEINDMFVGESEKNIKALFSLAKKLTPCVIFIDEADSIFSSRTQSRQRTTHREMINQFLREWDGMSNDAGGAFIMVATNRPFDLDDAVLRRLPRRVLVDLPAEQDRLEILKIHLKDEQLGEDVDLSSIASKSPFYSGSDLKNLSVAAALNCVREENELATQHTGQEEYVHPTKRTIYARHFEKALEEITASISDDMESLKAIKKFDEQFGDRRGKKKKSSKYGFRSPTEADQVLDTVKVRA